jgi:uncharacterized protein with PIN domain
MKNVLIRFYEELNDFLPPEKRKIRFPCHIIGQPSVKDFIESLGVPHNEIDLILVNSISVGFDYIVKENDDISIYPVFESFDIKNVQHLRPIPLRDPKFICDLHIGSLARYLRMAGFDTLYRDNYEKNEIVTCSLTELRTILTKDRELLKRKDVTHGYWIRNIDAAGQLKEVIKRFHLEDSFRPFSRCIECNGLISTVEKEKVYDRLEENTKKYFNEFFTCVSCGKIYWKGSHFKKMEEIFKSIK